MPKGDIEKDANCKREGMNSRMAEPNDYETHKKVFLKFDSRGYSFFDLPTPDLGYSKKGLRLEWAKRKRIQGLKFKAYRCGYLSFW